MSALIVASTWGILRESLNLAVDAVPARIDPQAARAYLEAVPGVVDVHDFHVWAMSTTEVALTAHLVTASAVPMDEVTTQVTHELEERFGIGHPTLQWESASRAEPCRQGQTPGG